MARANGSRTFSDDQLCENEPRPDEEAAFTKASARQVVESRRPQIILAMAGALCALGFLQSLELSRSPKSFCSAPEQPLAARLHVMCECCGGETEQR